MFYGKVVSPAITYIQIVFVFLFPLCSVLFLPEPLGIYRCFKRLTNKLFPTLFPENYSFSERKNFSRNALQSDGIRRVSPNLRLENQPAMAGMSRISDKSEKIEKGKRGCYKWQRNDIRGGGSPSGGYYKGDSHHLQSHLSPWWML